MVNGTDLSETKKNSAAQLETILNARYLSELSTHLRHHLEFFRPAAAAAAAAGP